MIFLKVVFLNALVAFAVLLRKNRGKEDEKRESALTAMKKYVIWNSLQNNTGEREWMRV